MSSTHYSDNALTLRGGEWITVRGVKRWTGPRPADEPDHQPSRPPAKCGTESGYRRHQRRHEAACDDCKAAKSAAGRRRYQRNKEKVA